MAGQYTVDSANTDSFVWTNRDMVITFSAGNEGVDANEDGVVDADSTGSPATSKNVITSQPDSRGLAAPVARILRELASDPETTRETS